ncbi:biotin transporter BioY [Pectinatus frisingensis]|uniref:biotin transporter BioY n=1 Tax=Pectinatus frisingensis TaxID=865 RepID=UPI0018C6DC27|nr:biotin transporter BioY [Pectinatus frisingensis]
MDKMTLFSIRNLTKMAVCIALCCVSAYISFPLPFTPGMVTALTLVMNLTAFLLSPKQTFIVILGYILLGIVGLPVFVGGTAGLGKILGPTGGFIIAFAVAYPIVSLLKGNLISLRRYFFIAVCVGIPITYIGGVVGMILSLHINIWQALIMAVFPFIPGDIIKSFAAAWIGVKLNRIFNQDR